MSSRGDIHDWYQAPSTTGARAQAERWSPRRPRCSLALTLAACGDDDDASDGSAAGSTPATAGGDTAAPTPTEDGGTATTAGTGTTAGSATTSGSATTGGSAAAPTGEPIVIAGLKGEVAEGGPDFVNGMIVAVDEINADGGVAGRPLEVQELETGGTPEGAATAYKEASDDGDVIGAFLGASGALAIRAQSETLGLPIITASGNDAIDIPVTQYVFSNSAGKEYATSAIAYAVNQLGAKSIAAIHYGTDFSSQIEDAITTRCEELGCEIVAVEEADATAPVDALIPQLTNMRNADPDVYYLEGLNPSVFAAARQLGIEKPIVSEQWLAVPALRDACGANCEGVTFAIHKCNVPELLQADDPLLELCSDRGSLRESDRRMGRIQHLRPGRGVHLRCGHRGPDRGRRRGHPRQHRRPDGAVRREPADDTRRDRDVTRVAPAHRHVDRGLHRRRHRDAGRQADVGARS